MELILINTFKHLEVYEKDWAAILEASENTNPFIEYEFVSNWWRFFGENKEIEIFAVKEHNRIIAFFPFESVKSWFGYKIQFLALGDANYMDIIAKKRDKERVIMFVFDELIKKKRSIVFYLHGLLESGDTPLKLANYLKARNLKERYSRIVTPFIDLQNISYEEYMKSRNKLHGMDRREKRLRALGEVKLQISPSSEINNVFKVHKKRWEKKNDTSGFSTEKKKAFFRCLAEQNNGNLRVRLSTLTLQNEMTAFTYSFACRGRYLGYVLGHDSDFDIYGPGRILVKEQIKRNIEDGFDKLDMSIGYEPYKFEWNTNLDYTRKTVFSTNTIKAKMIRNFLWVKEMLQSKIRKYYSIVLFRRNTIGKLKYFLRNKENIRFREVIWKRKIVPFLCDRKQYIIAKLDVNKINMISHFEKIDPQTVLELKSDRKEVLQKIFNGYDGYYSTDVKKAFWVNQNVIRIDEIEVVSNLKKRSVYITDWKNENIEEVVSFVQATYNPKNIFVHVNKRDKVTVKKLKKYSFELIERHSYSKIFGYKRVKKEVII